VLHDAAPTRVPDSYSRSFVAWYRLMAPRIGRVSHRVITVSELSRRELRASLRERGRVRTAELTWRATAIKLIEEISPWLM
jgi:hypothetical protein